MAFYRKYFPESMRETKDLELMQLKQDSLSVAEYTSRFENLCRFSRICQGAPESYESWKYVKYQGGLEDIIMAIVTPLEIRIFFELVNKARVVEDCAKKEAKVRGNRGYTDNRAHDDYLGPRGQKFKRNGEAKSSRAYSPDLRCQECGNYHSNKP
ncbi:uncharacterized protein LOC107486823 [Arachis duranensis]|uniref:Uncharacterized protein LOC107486823 n=1 Tax=Arachis duranensis TaxID=130453 RepID=A0A6P4D843_ARADU|nr:uncharacterized protein LOC107486823 [Arachis duranensis]